MKRISSKSTECAKAIGNREAFETHGALKATIQPRLGSWDSGQLSGADLNRFREDMDSITYTVWSYSTPIAWVAKGHVHKVAQKFSMTTSHHQGKLYLL